MDSKNLFISYSQNDGYLLETIKPYLQQLTIQTHFCGWDDTKIDHGDERKKEFAQFISKCDVALLLVSTNFLAYEFHDNEEIPGMLNSAKRKGVKIFILILDNCPFDEHHTLHKYQCLNDPTKPVEELYETSRKQLFVDITSEIKTVLNSISTK